MILQLESKKKEDRKRRSPVKIQIGSKNKFDVYLKHSPEKKMKMGYLKGGQSSNQSGPILLNPPKQFKRGGRN